MDTLFITLILTAGALALALYPLWRRQTRSAAWPDRAAPAGRTLEEYQARYQAALAAIKDLMFDYEMGKVSAEDYQTLLPKTRLQAANLRRQMDQLSPDTGPAIDPALDARIETLVAELKNGPMNDNEALRQEVEAEIEALKHLQPDAETPCPHCGHTAQPGDTFCSRCGQALPKTACPHCGHVVHSTDDFCARCGSVLNNNISIRKPDNQ